MGDAFLTLPGAVADPELGVAAHYGSPLPEQRALAAGEAIASLAHNGIVTVAGPDRLTWLDSMTSQRVRGLAAGESAETLLLDPNGRIEHAIRIVDDGERAWLLVDAGEAESLTQFLSRMRFALRVEVDDVSTSYAAVLTFAGPARDALADLGVVVAEWVDPWSVTASGGVQYARGEHPAEDWSAAQSVVLRVDLPVVAGLVTQGKARAAGLSALDALEIRAWRPNKRAEVDDRSIPHEFDWLRTAVHLNKGCYRGQETVAKVHNLGHPPRRLALLHLDGSGGELPPTGALVYLHPGSGAAEDAKPVGRVTRAALHFEWGGIALALLKRSVPEGADLAVGLADGSLVAATQEVIVPADAGRTREVPRLKRL